MLTFSLWCRERQLKEREEGEMCDAGQSVGSKRGADTESSRPKCEAGRSGWLNRDYNTLDYNGDEGIAQTEQHNG